MRSSDWSSDVCSSDLHSFSPASARGGFAFPNGCLDIPRALAARPIDVIVKHLVEMPDAKLLIPDPQPLESVRMHALLHGRKVEGVLIEHLPDRFVAMLEALVFGADRQSTRLNSSH